MDNWKMIQPRTFDLLAPNNLVAGQFRNVVIKPLKQRMDELPRLTIDKEGNARFNSTFLRSINQSTNTHVVLQYDNRLGVLRFKFDPNGQQNVANSTFKIPSSDAWHLSGRSASYRYGGGSKLTWAVVRVDGEWYSAKPVNSRHEIIKPDTLTAEQEWFWSLPHNFDPYGVEPEVEPPKEEVNKDQLFRPVPCPGDKKDILRPPVPPTPPATRVVREDDSLARSLRKGK